MSSDDRPRVLHVLGALSLGGIETWLLHMLRKHKEFAVRHELLLTKAAVGPYEAEVRDLGIRIHRLPLEEGKLNWFRRFQRLLEKEGPFAAIHSHATPYFAAPLLAAAKRAGVPIRLAHSHSARSKGDDYALRYRMARLVAMPWFDRVATRKIGITDAAIEEIAGKDWRDDPKASVLIYGFDFSHFRGAAERARKLRRKLGISESAPVVGNVARLDVVKNHRFLIEAFAAAVRQVPNAELVIVGEGPLRGQILEQAASLGIADRVHLPGTTIDIPAYMALFDLFALPSFSEGLGIVVVEAQAAGTRALVSETTPIEASVVPGAVEMLPLIAGAEAWAEATSRSLRLPRPDAGTWLEQVEKSRFGIRRCVDELNAIYIEELGATDAELAH